LSDCKRALLSEWGWERKGLRVSNVHHYYKHWIRIRIRCSSNRMSWSKLAKRINKGLKREAFTPGQCRAMVMGYQNYCRLLGIKYVEPADGCGTEQVD
jgi:hypothetical protein